VNANTLGKTGFDFDPFGGSSFTSSPATTYGNPTTSSPAMPFGNPTTSNTDLGSVSSTPLTGASLGGSAVLPKAFDSMSGAPTNKPLDPMSFGTAQNRSVDPIGKKTSISGQLNQSPAQPMSGDSDDWDFNPRAAPSTVNTKPITVVVPTSNSKASTQDNWDPFNSPAPKSVGSNPTSSVLIQDSAPPKPTSLTNALPPKPASVSNALPNTSFTTSPLPQTVNPVPNLSIPSAAPTTPGLDALGSFLEADSRGELEAKKT
jgi:hypothetical protein